MNLDNLSEYLNLALTFVLICIYLYNTKAQNKKINTQSDIINDLQNHIKFFDVVKIKEYVELRENEKDKLLEITKQTLEKELKLKSEETRIDENFLDKQVDEITNFVTKMVKEPYVYILTNLIFKKDNEIEKILNKSFPENKEIVRELIEKSRTILCEKMNTNNFDELRKKYNQ